MPHSSAPPSPTSTALGRTVLVLCFTPTPLLPVIPLDGPYAHQTVLTVGEEPAPVGGERQGANVVDPVIVTIVAQVGVEEGSVGGAPQPDLPGSSAGGEQVPVGGESERGHVDVTIQFVYT